jgi:hypothetical protein
MRPHLLRLLGLAVLLFLAGSASGNGELWADRGPSTQKERTRALRLVRQLEAEPLGADAASARRWLALWLLDVPDLQVRYCAEVLGGDRRARERVRPELLAQVPWSGAAFLIENPGKKDSKAEVYTAGVLGTLRAYEALVRVKPEQRTPLLDDLVARRDAGSLAGYVAETSQACP